MELVCFVYKKRTRRKADRGALQRAGSYSMLKEKMIGYLTEAYAWAGIDGLDEIEVAIYWFAVHYHGGQTSGLYSISSTSPYRPSRNGTLESEGEAAKMLYEALTEKTEFQK